MMPEHTRLLVFVKPPVPGQVKTRLASVVGDVLAADLYRAFMQDLLTRLPGLPWLSVTLCVAGDPDHPLLCEALRAMPAWPRREQRGAGLGERMAEALAWAHQHAAQTILIGSDLPTLPAARLRAASLSLAEHQEMVLGPSEDGGYYLVGARKGVNPPLCDRSIRYSTGDALADTKRACAEAGIHAHLLEPWFDVDDANGLARLARDLALDSTSAPNTATLLRSMNRI